MEEFTTFSTQSHPEIGSVDTNIDLFAREIFSIKPQPEIIFFPNPFLEVAIQRNTQTIQDLEERVQTLESKGEVEYTTYILNSFPSKKLQLKKPLAVLLKETPEGFIAEVNDITIWGDGDIEEQAIRNLCTDLENFYFDLEREKGNLGIEMQRQREFLQEFLQKKGKKK